MKTFGREAETTKKQQPDRGQGGCYNKKMLKAFLEKSRCLVVIAVLSRLAASLGAFGRVGEKDRGGQVS